MGRLILTFETLFQVLSADKLLRNTLACRPTPTPAGLSTSICSISLELLDPSDRQAALNLLDSASLAPTGVHDIP